MASAPHALMVSKRKQEIRQRRFAKAPVIHGIGIAIRGYGSGQMMLKGRCSPTLMNRIQAVAQPLRRDVREIIFVSRRTNKVGSCTMMAWRRLA